MLTWSHNVSATANIRLSLVHNELKASGLIVLPTALIGLAWLCSTRSPTTLELEF
jgi:hypothetical protein